MAQSLDYSSRATPSGDSLGRHAFTVIAALSTLLVVLLCGLWIISYFGTTPTLDSRGFALSAPPGPHIPLPIPSDYPQYVIPLRGNLERWEHASVGGGWYRWHRGLPIWLLAFPFAILPSAWVMRRYVVLVPPGGAASASAR